MEASVRRRVSQLEVAICNLKFANQYGMGNASPWKIKQGGYVMLTSVYVP